VDLLAAWLLFPLVGLLVCWGVGLLIERVAGGLPGALVVPLGMAGVVSATQLTTYWDWSAELTVPLVLVLAVAGFALGRARLGRRPDPLAVAALAGVFAVFAAPVVLSGEATFAGYTVLGDTSIHLIGADALLEHGRDFSALPPSSYEYSLVAYYGANGYPSGGPTAVGALTALVGQDVAWTFQPFLTLLVVLSALQLWSLLTPLVESRRLRALLTFVAAQPSLVLAYALQGSVKEVGAAWGVLLVAALIPVYAAAPPGPRRVVPLAVAFGALIGIVGVAAMVWLGPFLLVALAAGVMRRRPRWGTLVLEIGVFAVLAAVLTYQAIVELSTYVEVSGAVVQAQQEFGNLLGPLDPLHVLGVWLTGDYRIASVANLDASNVLSGVVAGAFAIGVIGAIRRRSWYALSFLGVSLFAYWYVTTNGSPWADGKAMMIVSPAIMFGAAIGAAFLHSLDQRALAWGLAVTLAFGVLWSNALQYHDVSLAPRDRLAELADLGDRLAGQGPTLYTEFEEFGKHFLRDAAPEGSSEGWQRRFALAKGRDGQFPRFGNDNDTDQYTDEYLRYYRTIVVPRGFFGSRPPSIYRRIDHGDYYDVWQRAPGAEDDLIRHVSLGAGRNPAAPAPCATVRSVARTAAAAGGSLAYAELPQFSAFVPSETAYPRGWFPDPVDGNVLQARGQGRVEDSIRLPRAGRYSLWVEGSFRREWRVFVDGREVAPLRAGLGPRLGDHEVTTLPLSAGKHVITLVRPGGSIWPGNGGPGFLGPVVLAPEEVDTRPAATIAPARWRSLCGRSLDWVEAVR
jgi:hypothetical protein